MFTSMSRLNHQTLGGEDMLAIQVNVCYILKHLEDRKALSVHIYYTWCDIILIFKLHKNRAQKNPAYAGSYASFFYTQFENSNDVTPV